jgi:hypothetical protein
MHAKMARTQQVGHRQARTLVLPRNRDNEFAVAFPELGQRLLPFTLVIAAATIDQQLPFPLCRQIGTTKQGAHS